MYAIELWDYATPSYFSSSKTYFGDLTDVTNFVKHSKDSDIESMLERFNNGEKNLTHNVAYHDVKFLEPCEVVFSEDLICPQKCIKYRNIWGCIYLLKFDSAKIHQDVVKFGKKYYRIGRAYFKNLEYKLSDRSDWWDPLKMFWGQPGLIYVEHSQDESGDYTVNYSLSLIEKKYDTQEEAVSDCNDINRINWMVFAEDIFADG